MQERNWERPVGVEIMSSNGVTKDDTEGNIDVDADIDDDSLLQHAKKSATVHKLDAPMGTVWQQLESGVD